jgi:hypothetical protein
MDRYLGAIWVLIGIALAMGVATALRIAG